MNKQILFIGTFLLVCVSATLNAQTWQSLKRLTWNSGYSFNPRIAIDSGHNIYLVWSDTTPGHEEIYFKKSTNGGNSWSTKRLSWSPGQADKPKIAIDSNDDIHIVWLKNTPGNYELFYKKSTSGGNTWTATKRLTWTAGNSDDFDLATDSNDVIHLCWQDKVQDVDTIFYKKSTNGGTSWTGTKRLTWGTDVSDRPAIACDLANDVHVIWRKDISGKWYSFYRRANSSGIWGSTKRLTWNSNHVLYLDIVLDASNRIHGVWDDDKPGNREIFYKKGIQ